MATAEHCRAMAAEADRLASIVSYTRDKDRLREQARSWRDRAAVLDARGAADINPPQGLGRLRGWLRGREG